MLEFADGCCLDNNAEKKQKEKVSTEQEIIENF